ncbi:MAG TPA: sigma-70 factor domain-containing protein, partial [Candidatus Hydrogenedentes bacterium]|nr:sigma-70 factor domain-containing protein [Candidatus Hydrogenedentota bacterium]
MSTEKKKEIPNKNTQKKEDALELAKKRGKITYDDLLDILPEDASWEAMDELMVKLGGMNVEVVDEFRMDAETQQAQQKKEALGKKAVIRRDATHSTIERADDPVRMYLREMGRVPLLKKEQEVEIA